LDSLLRSKINDRHSPNQIRHLLGRRGQTSVAERGSEPFGSEQRDLAIIRTRDAHMMRNSRSLCTGPRRMMMVGAMDGERAARDVINPASLAVEARSISRRLLLFELRVKFA
jgi:hypothetical protein